MGNATDFYIDLIKEEHGKGISILRSIEDRAGILLAILTPLVLLLYQKYSLSVILSLVKPKMTSIDTIQLIVGVLIYLILIPIIGLLCKILLTSKSYRYDISRITDSHLDNELSDEKYNFFYDYRRITEEVIAICERKSRFFSVIVILIIIEIVLVFIFTSIGG